MNILRNQETQIRASNFRPRLTVLTDSSPFARLVDKREVARPLASALLAQLVEHLHSKGGQSVSSCYVRLLNLRLHAVLGWLSSAPATRRNQMQVTNRIHREDAQ